MPWGTSRFIELHETLQQAALLSNVELNNMVLNSIELLMKPIENDLLNLLVTPAKNQTSRTELQKGELVKIWAWLVIFLFGGRQY